MQQQTIWRWLYIGLRFFLVPLFLSFESWPELEINLYRLVIKKCSGSFVSLIHTVRVTADVIFFANPGAGVVAGITSPGIYLH
jgi:hypothetical protein